MIFKIMMGVIKVSSARLGWSNTGKGRQGTPKQAANILNYTTGRKQGSSQVELLQLKGNKCGRCSHERQLKQRLYMSSKDTWTYFKSIEVFEDFCENQNLGIKMQCKTVDMPSQVRMPKIVHTVTHKVEFPVLLPHVYPGATVKRNISM